MSDSRTRTQHLPLPAGGCLLLQLQLLVLLWAVFSLMLLDGSTHFSAAAVSEEDDDDSSAVIRLTEDSFNSKVLTEPELWLVEYFQEHCQGCMQFEPHLREVATNLDGIVKVGTIDCKEFPRPCVQAKIEHVPALRAYGWDLQRNPYTGKYYKDDPVHYSGDMKARSVTKFITGLLPAHLVSNITSGESAEKFLSSSPHLAKVVVFSSKAAPSPLVKGIALHFRGRLLVAQAPSDDEDLVAKFGATSFPAVFVQTPAGEVLQFDGQQKAWPLRQFLEEHAAKAEYGEAVGRQGGASSSSGSSSDKKGGEGGEEGEGGGDGGKRVGGEEGEGKRKPSWVIPGSGKMLAEKLEQSEEAWLAAFVGKQVESCKPHLEAWLKAQEELPMLIRTVQLNVSSDADAAELAEKYKVASVVADPSRCLALLLFPFGDAKEDEEAELFEGNMDGKELAKFVQERLPGTFVQPIVERNVDSFVQMSPRKPKAILFTSKRDVPPIFRALSTNYRKSMEFGQAHESDRKVMAQFNITKVPSILVLFPQPDPRDPSNLQLAMAVYGGPLKYRHLAQFAQRIVNSVSQLFGDAPEVVEVADDEGFKKACVDISRLCVVGLFKQTSESALQNFQLVASKWAEGGQFSFLWIDFEKLPGILGQLEVPASSLPSAVIISPTKMRIAVLPDVFSAESLDSFLSNVLSGKLRTQPLEKLPSLSSAAASSSSSSSGASETQPEEETRIEEAVEEEFSLDDIMSEAVEDDSALGTKSQKLEQVELELEEEKRKAEEEAKNAKKSTKKSKKKKKKSSAKDTSKDEL